MIWVALIRAYRLIPARVRRVWSFGGSSSALALVAAEAGDGRAAVVRYALMPLWRSLGERGGPSWEDPRDV